MPVFHYHGEDDIPIKLETVIENIEISWKKLGWVDYTFESEPGLGHDISKTGYDKANNFMFRKIKVNENEF